VPLYAHHFMAGDWMLMLHYAAEAGYDAQFGTRGSHRFLSINWVMGMAHHDLGPGRVTFMMMNSLEAATLGDRLQTCTDDAGQRIAFEAEIARLHPEALLLMCGPLPMLDAVRAAWAAAGRPPANLRFETFGNTGSAANETFWVRLPRHGIELTVPADSTLLDVLNEHGIATLYDCRRGECGLCAVDIVEAHGRVDHRDVFLSPRQKQTNERLCACVSRVSGGGLVLDSAYRPD